MTKQNDVTCDAMRNDASQNCICYKDFVVMELCVLCWGVDVDMETTQVKDDEL